MARSLRKSGYTTPLDISEVGRLLHELEGRLGQLAAFISANAREASGTVPDRISDAWSDVSERVRTSLRHNARGVGAEASRIGTGVWHTIEDEVVNRPLLALAIAAGIGFVIGALNRR